MLSYCLKYKTKTTSKNPRVEKAKNGREMLLSNCVICGIKKSSFLKKQEISGLMSKFQF